MSFHVRRLGKPRKPQRQFPWKRALLIGAEIAGPATAWFFAWKAKHDIEVQRQQRITMLKRALLILVAVLCAFLLLAGTVKGLMALRVVSLGDVAAIAGTAPATDAHGHINILLLGQGDAGHDGKDLTDTIMVASLDPSNTKSVVLLSLPRDLYFLKTDKMGDGRLNSMYRDYKNYLWLNQGMDPAEAEIAAMQELATEVGRKLNLDIAHAIKVDFVGFVKAVDTLGGIELDVPYDIIDTEYPDDNYGYQTFEIRQGRQRLDGTTALKYARSRHTTSDFDRSARQQQVIKALVEKAQDSGLMMDPAKITSLYRVLSDHVKNTMSVREVVGLAEVGRQLQRDKVITMQISDRNGLYDSVAEPGGFLYTPPRSFFDGASVLLPVSVPEFPITWRQLRTLTTLLLQQRNLYLSAPQVSVLNAGARSGNARRLGNELTRYGFAVTNISNASSPKQPISTVSVRGEADAALGQVFGLLLGMATNPLPAGLPPEEVSQITIILGEQYTYKPLQDLIPTAE